MAGHSKWVSIRYRKGTQPGRSRAPAQAVMRSGERFRCEGYGPGGAAVLMDCLGERERAITRVRQTLQRYGGHLGAGGSVDYLFNRVGLMLYPPGTDEESLIQSALEAGAEDVVVNSDNTIEVLADPLEFETVRALLLEKNFAPDTAEVTERASTSVRLAGEVAVAMLLLLEALEDLEDIQNVYTNAEISDEVLAGI